MPISVLHCRKAPSEPMSPLQVLILHLLALLAGGRPVLQPKGSKFDALISLQGSRPVDIDGNEVSCTARRRHA